MSPRPAPQPVTRAQRASHPLAREAAPQGPSAPLQGPSLVPADRSTGQVADQHATLTGRQRSTRRQDAVFSTRVPAEVKKRLRRYAFEHDLLVQDIVTDLLQAYLAEHDA